MCGIYACFYCKPSHTRNTLLNRGPDAIYECSIHNGYLAFYRLAIVGIESGKQPFKLDNKYLLCNGEIYNYDSFNYDTKTSSDCECILYLYNKHGIEHTVLSLDGEYAFILVDNDKVYFVRDPIGIKPLFYYDSGNSLEISSELKAMQYPGIPVLPRKIYCYDLTNRTLYHTQYMTFTIMPNHISTITSIHNTLYNAVIKRISQSERPVGFLLSGGLDSSLILSMALSTGLLRNPDVFTFGFSYDAPDVLAATRMVDYLYSIYGNTCFKWHLVVQPIDKGLDVLDDVIYSLETYDTTTIRAATPMYLISKYIREKTNTRVILSGEGADELFGGYLYFMYAPNDFAYKCEILKLLNELHYFDVLRADRATARWGLEMRPPFLDKYVIKDVLSYNHTKPRGTTKELLRKVATKYLPNDILNGKKEAFSDAVSLNWQDIIERKKKYIKFTSTGHINAVSNTAKYFQSVFNKHFPNRWDILPHLWLPNQLWVNTGDEPSARVLSCY